MSGSDDMWALDWGEGKGGSLFDFSTCNPCCGEPCNNNDGAMCVFCWWCCGACSLAKLYSHSLEQECAWINHCVIAFFLGWCAASWTRHNLRVKNGIGKPAGDMDGLIGDFVIQAFCGACALCQMLRSVDRSAWDWQLAMNAGPPTSLEWKLMLDS
jgi:Cys-rich protein (TIGR01571 family)